MPVICIAKAAAYTGSRHQDLHNIWEATLHYFARQEPQHVYGNVLRSAGPVAAWLKLRPSQLAGQACSAVHCVLPLQT